jgi:hypothetical protein
MATHSIGRNLALFVDYVTHELPLFPDVLQEAVQEE